VKKIVLGENHFSVGHTLYNMSCLLIDNKQYDDSLVMLQNTLDVYKVPLCLHTQIYMYSFIHARRYKIDRFTCDNEEEIRNSFMFLSRYPSFICIYIYISIKSSFGLDHNVTQDVVTQYEKVKFKLEQRNLKSSHSSLQLEVEVDGNTPPPPPPPPVSSPTRSISISRRLEGDATSGNGDGSEMPLLESSDINLNHYKFDMPGKENHKKTQLVERKPSNLQHEDVHNYATASNTPSMPDSSSDNIMPSAAAAVRDDKRMLSSESEVQDSDFDSEAEEKLVSTTLTKSQKKR
jgi:hypothetical protein